MTTATWLRPSECCSLPVTPVLSGRAQASAHAVLSARAGQVDVFGKLKTELSTQPEMPCLLPPSLLIRATPEPRVAPTAASVMTCLSPLAHTLARGPDLFLPHQHGVCGRGAPGQRLLDATRREQGRWGPPGLSCFCPPWRCCSSPGSCGRKCPRTSGSPASLHKEARALKKPAELVVIAGEVALEMSRCLEVGAGVMGQV